MFQKFNEQARRLIFFARYEASQLGNRTIEPGHFFLAVIREARPLLSQFLENYDIDDLAQQIRIAIRGDGKTPTSVELPLSQKAKDVFVRAEEEAAEQKYIGPEHLLIGLLRQPETYMASLLSSKGLESADFVNHLRVWLSKKPPELKQPHIVFRSTPAETLHTAESARRFAGASLAISAFTLIFVLLTRRR